MHFKLNKTKGYKKWIVNKIGHLPYNLMLLSTSPNEFFAMHLYDPISSFWNFRMVSVIRVSYNDNDVSWTLYFGEETIISPVDWSPLTNKHIHIDTHTMEKETQKVSC